MGLARLHPSYITPFSLLHRVLLFYIESYISPTYLQLILPKK